MTKPLHDDAGTFLFPEPGIGDEMKDFIPVWLQVVAAIGLGGLFLWALRCFAEGTTHL